MTLIVPALGSAISPEWLTATLRDVGMLPTDTVVNVVSHANAAFNAAAVHLDVTYSPDAPDDAPTRLFLKRNLDATWARAAGATEVQFYQLVAPLQQQLPMLVLGYASAIDADSGDTFCLLSDVSATHTAPVTRADLIAWRGVPSDQQLDAIVDAIARFHAYWWQHPTLGKDIAQVSSWYSDQEHFAAHVQRRRREWAAFRQDESATLPAHYLALYEQVVSNLPRLWEPFLAPRIAARRHLTLTHGDCYLSQFLCPNDLATQPTYLIDFQDVSADFCTVDLAHLFAIFWTSAQRHEGEREQRLLRHYLATLQAAGVQGYSWDDLVQDYRLLIYLLVLYPVWDQTNGSSKAYWWPKMQGLVSAFEDWECSALLP